jgi:IS5 family transposase
MKAHVGTDRRRIVHSLSTTAANVRDSTEMSKLLHGAEREVFGDQAYWNESHRRAALARGIRYRINRRPNHTPLSKYQRWINQRRSAHTQDSRSLISICSDAACCRRSGVATDERDDVENATASRRKRDASHAIRYFSMNLNVPMIIFLARAITCVELP